MVLQSGFCVIYISPFSDTDSCHEAVGIYFEENYSTKATFVYN